MIRSRIPQLIGIFILGSQLGWPPARALAAPYTLPMPEIETLPNGLQLVWFLNDHLPVVDLAVVLKSGDRDDPWGKAGTAELLANLLDRGADGMNAEQIARAAERLGASRYASTDDDTFSVGMHGLSPDAPALLELLSKVALKPDFPQAEVKREHQRLLDQWEHLGDYGENLVSLAYRRVITGGTTYGRGGFLSATEFNRVTRADVVRYYQRNFTPKNAVLMIVGRVDKPSFRAKIASLFGGWRGEAPKHEWKEYADPRLPTAESCRGQVLVIDRPDLTQAQVRMGFPAPLVQDPRHYSLTVANALLGEYFDSRLNSLIRDKLGLTYGISSSFSYSMDSSIFTVSSSTRNESVGELIHKTIEVLQGLKTGPIPGDEIDMAKDYLIGGFPLGTSTLSLIATRWLTGYLFRLSPGYLNEFVSKVGAVTSRDVVSAVGQTFNLTHLVVAVAGDAKAIEASLKRAKLPYRRISTQALR